jgi:molecular chaperone DnaJ
MQEGEAGYHGGPPGDLYVVLHVKPHPLFEREGPNLICEVPISIAQAALGCEVEVPTLEGKKTLEIDSGTQSGETLVLRGGGLPRLGGGPRGDQQVKIFVEVPTRLSAEERTLLEEFARVSGNEVTPRRKGFLDKLRELFE